MDGSGQAIVFTPEDQERVTHELIEAMASDGLRTIGLAYRRFSACK